MEATDYESAMRMAKSRRRKLANNTYLEINDDSFGVRLHDTQVVKWYRDGSIRLNTGGFLTVKTKDRMNRAIRPKWSVYSECGVWFVTHKGHDPAWHPYAYADDMLLLPTGLVEGMGLDPKAARKLRKEVKGFANDYIKELIRFKVPKPSGADCWYCLMEMDHWRDTDHLLHHMEEKYYVPSLIQRAIERFPVSPAATTYLSEIWTSPLGPDSMEFLIRDMPTGRAARHDEIGVCGQQLERSLRRFIYEKIGTSR